MYRFSELLGPIRGVAFATVLFATSSGAHADSWWEIIPADVRTSARPLEMVVHVAQDSLRAGRDPADGGQARAGLLAELFKSQIQSALLTGAEKGLASSQDALTATGADAALMEGIRHGLSSASWIKLSDGTPLRDNTITAKSALLDEAKGASLLDVDCSYNISQRFHAVYAYCLVQIASKATPTGNPADRWKPGHLLYSRPVEAEIELAHPAKSVGGRREQWTANSGALLRKGLDLALRNVGELVGRQLQLSQTDLDTAKANPQERIVDAYVGTAYSHQGHILDGSENILERVSPNAGGRLLLFKPNAGGVILLEKYSRLFYTYSIDAAAS